MMAMEKNVDLIHRGPELGLDGFLHLAGYQLKARGHGMAGTHGTGQQVQGLGQLLVEFPQKAAFPDKEVAIGRQQKEDAEEHGRTGKRQKDIPEEKAGAAGAQAEQKKEGRRGGEAGLEQQAVQPAAAGYGKKYLFHGPGLVEDPVLVKVQVFLAVHAAGRDVEKAPAHELLLRELAPLPGIVEKKHQGHDKEKEGDREYYGGHVHCGSFVSAFSGQLSALSGQLSAGKKPAECPMSK